MSLFHNSSQVKLAKVGEREPVKVRSEEEQETDDLGALVTIGDTFVR